ncbi:helix-turn-helix transcriptional regulator [Sphingobacterium sp. Mn56C]|uniref:helix-turn-helix transcriptional regulator n=1 Tax=Sphingobacterium sp. Mn56C TaxID=3395261 RepID=UPI003BBDDA28
MILNTEVPNDFITQLTLQGGKADENGRVTFPENIGRGYVKLVNTIPGLSILVQQFEVFEPFLIKRLKHEAPGNTLIFSFRNLDVNSSMASMARWPAVQVSTSDMAMDIQVAPHRFISNIILGIDINWLKPILTVDSAYNRLEKLMNNQQPYLYEELISPAINKVANEVFNADNREEALSALFYKIKAEELIYLFLSEFLKRNTLRYYALNQHDLQQIYGVKEHIINRLDTAPALPALARMAGMSVSKLGKLFRQVFGDSIYNYYQKVRMQHAAFLLREKKVSVSEVGYTLGFTNLSHFTRLFEKHMGIKPKKYSIAAVL